MTERKIVFLYAGQGSQRVGMGLDFYENKEVFRTFLDEMEAENPGFDLKKLMFEGPIETLSQTQYTQACMAAFAAGVTKTLKAEGIVPAAAAGLSLGEYGALCAAGVWNAKEYVKLTRFRGEQMAKCAEGIDCAMSAILGLDGETIEKVVKETAEGQEKAPFVTVANFNCPGQTVICGEEAGVAAAEESLKAAGAKRCVRLNVSGPFHTKFMKGAGDALAEYFTGLVFEKPQIPVAMNTSGRLLCDGESIQELLVRQVQSSVRFESDLRALLAAGYEDFVEIGPGNVLSGFLKKTAREEKKKIRSYVIDTLADFEKTVEQLKA